MNRKIRVMTAIYKNISLKTADARKVRGFFSDLDMSDSILHNHTLDGVEIYRYPKIQYKVLNGGEPTIVAVEEGISSIHPHLMNQKELQIGNQVFTDTSLDIHLSEKPLGDIRRKISYQFITPWIALNQRNYKIYQKSSDEERELLLQQILIGNVLSLCKGLGVTIEGKLEVEHQLKERTVLYKGKKMEGFIGTFQINCCIPELLGIGKGTARGFGTVKILKEKRKEEVPDD